MESLYTWARIGNNGQYGEAEGHPTIPHILDICGALVQGEAEFKAWIDRCITPNTTLCITGELKRYCEGEPASNYRYKKDEHLNRNVINNYLYLFTLHQERTNKTPVFVTTIPRSWRLYSWFIQDNGSIIRKNNKQPTNELMVPDVEDRLLLDFLDIYGVNSTALIKIRESCKGARYHTYLIDMISFLYQMEILLPSTLTLAPSYSMDYRVVVSSDDELSKLSFEDTLGNDGTVFFSPKNEDINQLYQELDMAISPQENTVKKYIRAHLVNHRIDRWTDFDANDTDDAFLFLMLIHAFKGDVGRGVQYNEVGMTSEESDILNSLEIIMKPWFSQLE